MKIALFSAALVLATLAQGAYFPLWQALLALFFLGCAALSRQKPGFDLNSLLLLLLFCVMAASSFFSLSAGAASAELVKYSLFPLSYAFFAGLSQEEKGRAGEAFYFAFFLLMVFGLLGMAGLSPFGGMVTELGGRLQSFLGYANTSALLMGTGVFCATEKLLASRGRARALHAAACALFFAAMVFTLSRASLVLFVCVYAMYASNRFFSARGPGRRGLAAAGAGALLVLAVLALADSRVLRISVFAPTLVERYISYWDALPMLLRTPFGAGLGNWQFLQFSYQSAPYTVRYIHNFYLQAALDGGLAALGIVMFYAAGFGKKFFRAKGRRDAHFYIGAFLLSSAFFEVHFNFGLVIVYSMYLLARLCDGRPYGFGALRDFESRLPRAAVRLVAVALALPVAAAAVSESFAGRGRRQEAAGDWQAARASFSAARTLNPLNDDLLFELARTAPSSQDAFGYLQSALEANPRNTEALFSIADGLLHFGEHELALEYALRLVEIFPLSQRNHELLRRVIDGFGEPRRGELRREAELRVDGINGRINPLFRHIDEGFRIELEPPLG